jgi:hypothetical protein
MYNNYYLITEADGAVWWLETANTRSHNALGHSLVYSIDSILNAKHRIFELIKQANECKKDVFNVRAYH